MLVARDEDLELLENLPNGFYVFQGRGGIGKSALMEEFAKRNNAIYISEFSLSPFHPYFNLTLILSRRYAVPCSSTKAVIESLREVAKEKILVVDGARVATGTPTSTFYTARDYVAVFEKVFLVLSGEVGKRYRDEVREVRELSLEEGREVVKSWGESEELADIAYETRGYMDLKFARMLVLQRNRELSNFVAVLFRSRSPSLMRVAEEIYERGETYTGEVANALGMNSRKVTYYIDILDHMSLINKKLAYNGAYGVTKRVHALLDREQVLEGLRIATKLKKI
jgi:AAA+ ATPase superfamily predicted ATPase